MTREEYTKILEDLIKKYPKAFSLKKPKILKKRIHKDILGAFPIERKALMNVLFRYCNSKDYIKAHRVGAKRYDLQGNETGEYVTLEEVSLKEECEK